MTQTVPTGLPLQGVRVLDLSRVLAGPWSAQVLGDLGAEVIKVEHPIRGDDTRDWGVQTGATNTSYFDAVNRNKRSVTVDLTTAEGVDQVRAMARSSDILVENFKHGGAEKLGIGVKALAAENPRLIYCSITGYASDGPEATRPGYDLLVQGEAGLMAINGEATQPPLKFGIAIVDLFAGQYAAQAILAALYERERTGRGRHVELCLFDAGISLTSYYGLEALHAGIDPPRFGNSHPSIIPYGVFDAADGKLVITVGNNAQFRRFCEHVIERPELADDDLFATNLARGRNRSSLLPILEAELRRRTKAELLLNLRKSGIPAGELLGLHQALTSDRAMLSGMVVQNDAADSGVGRASVFQPPYRFDGHRLPVRWMPPALGEANGQLPGQFVDPIEDD